MSDGTISEQQQMMRRFREEFPDVITIEDAMRRLLALKVDRDKIQSIADELAFAGNCSETCVDGTGGDDCSCLWGGAVWEYQQAVRDV